MDLETFVANSLIAVASGLRSANKTIGDQWTEAGRKTLEGPYFSLLNKAAAADRCVDFDVAVTAAAKGELDVEGKMSILVADAALTGSGELAHERVSRVRFRVNVEQLIF
jgi:hypothetical protein